jgi:soluble lytic murein transglycosylase
MKHLIAPAVALFLLIAPQAGAQQSALAQALALGRSGDWAGAQAAVQGAGAVAGDLLDMTRLRAGEGLLGDYESFLSRRGDWPNLGPLRVAGEKAVARSTTPDRVLRWFEGRSPQTAVGLLALTRAERAAGRDPGLRRHWVTISLTADEQAEVLAAEGAALRVQDHEARLDHLLWEGRSAEAERMLPLVSPGWQALARARLGLAANAPGPTALVAAVPQALADHPGLAHARMDWRARNGQEDGAIDLIRARPADSLGRPEAWVRRRMGYARTLWREKRQPQAAYALVAPHGLTGGASFVDAEFMAGHIALRGLNDPDRALRHFHALRNAVSTPISIARGDYWIGRALEAKGDSAGARAAYARAAQHQTAYYGLLAAERLAQALDPTLARPAALPDWRGAAFLRDDRIAAYDLLTEAGQDVLARRFVLALAEGLPEPDLARLGAWALARNDLNLAVLIGKQAAAKGVILPGIYFPDPGALLPQGLRAPRALAAAIARRESEFLISAVSPAGALGLMQVMPGTAAQMARKLGEADQQAALTRDAAYNARLGAAYLEDLRAEFGSSLALVAAGYNAGPSRPRRWIETLGDPRRADVDIVDWVEGVPFAETRTYIMRVLEGLVIYAAREGGGGALRVSDILSGRGAP